jgi:hypothetical protein
MPYFSRLVALFFCLGTTTGWASTVLVNWQPAAIVHNMRSGTVSVEEVVFVPNVTTKAAKIHVSGEIRKYISVFPASFDSLQVNGAITLSIEFTIPKDQSPKQLNGSIRILSAADPADSAEDADDDSTVGKLSLSILVQKPTVDVVPSGIALPSPDRVITDPRLSNQFAMDEVDVLFTSAATLDAVKEKVSRLNLAFIGSDTDLGYYQLVSNQLGYDNLINIIGLLETEPNVVSASLHNLFTPFAFPNDPGSDLSYGPNLINLPLAWNISTGLKGTDQGELPIGIIDTDSTFAILT